MQPGHAGDEPAALGGGQVGRLAGSMVVRAQAPLSALAGYQTRLNALTSGEGHYTLALSHYDAVPPSVQQQLVAGWRAHDED